MGISITDSAVNLYNVNTPGTSVTQKLTELKAQRKELEQQLKNGADNVRGKITSLDKQISNLESRINKLTGKEECQTCNERKYKDGSDDPGVSFKTATKVKPGNATTAVIGHEHEHVVRERAEAERENREVVAQSVTIKSDICPECGKSYVSGGETITVTKSKPENPYNVGIEDESQKSGKTFDKII